MEAARLQVTVGADTRSAEAALNSFDQKLKAVAKGMTQTGTAMTLGLTLPLAAVAKNALGLAADYEQSMNVLQTVTGATDKAMEKMSERALQLGAETSFSAGEAAEGMLELGKAGMNATQIYDAMPGVLALAAAGQISVAEASAVTASTLNAFNLEASESTRIADLLAGAANASQANISDLSQGMQQAGFAFKLANQPVEYLAASLALLTDQGLTGSDAGTALKNAFMRMVNPTGEATAEMEKLGISFYDASGNMKQLPDIIGMINSATEGLTNQQRDAALATIFLSDGMKAIIPLLDAGTEGFNKTVETVTEVGAATKVSDALMKGLGGGIEYLSGSVETFLLGAALPFTEELGNMARKAGDLVTEIGNLPPDVLALALGFLAVTAAAGPTLVILGSLAGAVSALGAPLALAILGIIGLSFAWGLNLGGIRDKTAEIVPVIQEWFNNLSTDVAAVATAISTAFSNTTFPTIDELWADFQAGDAQLVATKIADAAGNLIVNLNTELKFTSNVDALKTKFQGFITQMTADIAGLDFGPASTKLSAKIDELAADIKGLNLDGINWVDVLTRVILGPLGAAINTLKWLVTPEQFANLKTAVKTALDTISWADLGVSFGGLTTAISGQLTKIGQDIIRDFKAAFPATPTAQGKEPDFRWEEVGAAPATLIENLIDGVVEFDWASAGKGVGAMIGLWFAGEMAKVKFFQDNPTLITDFNNSWNEFQKQIGAEMRSGWDNALGEDPFGRLGTAIKTGWNEFIEGLVGTIMSAFITPTQRPAAYTNGLNMGSPEGPAEPQWVTDLKNLQIPAPTWWTDFINWQIPYPDWLVDLTTWEIKKPEWLERFLNWKIDLPSWLGGTPDAEEGGGGGASGGMSSPKKYSLRPPTDTQAAPEPLDWAKYVKPLDWLAYVKPFNWQQVTQPLAWQQFIQRMEWQAFVQPITWSQFVQMLNWSGYVARLSWNSFVSALGWNSYVGDLDWGSFVDKLDWGRFIDSVKVGSNAAGTSNWRGGLTWVGEEGAEIVDLPRGSRIYSNEESMAMTSGMTVNISVASLNNDIDIASLAMKVAREIARRTR